MNVSDNPEEYRRSFHVTNNAVLTTGSDRNFAGA